MWWWLSNAKLAFWITFFVILTFCRFSSDRFRLWLVHEMYDIWVILMSHHNGTMLVQHILLISFFGVPVAFSEPPCLPFFPCSLATISLIWIKNVFFKSPRRSVSSNKIIVSFYKVFRSSRTFYVIILNRSNLSIQLLIKNRVS